MPLILGSVNASFTIGKMLIILSHLIWLFCYAFCNSFCLNVFIHYPCLSEWWFAISFKDNNKHKKCFTSLSSFPRSHSSFRTLPILCLAFSFASSCRLTAYRTTLVYGYVYKVVPFFYVYKLLSSSLCMHACACVCLQRFVPHQQERRRQHFSTCVCASKCLFSFKWSYATVVSVRHIPSFCLHRSIVNHVRGKKWDILKQKKTK